MDTGDQFTGHMKRTDLIVLVATGRTEAAVASEGNKLQVAAVRAAVHGTAVGGVTAVDHFGDVVGDSRAGMKFIDDMFVMVSKNKLGDVFMMHKNILQ